MLVAAGIGSLMAHDFSLTTEAGKLYFEITDTKEHTASVTYRDRIKDGNPCELENKVVIPAKVRHKGVVYDITEIGPMAFAGGKNIISVSMPSSVKKIGNFAFDGCERLREVDFPTDDVDVAADAFFGCTSLSNLNFGENWSETNLRPYHWSKSLQSIYIPSGAKNVTRIYDLDNLKEIKVSEENEKFRSVDGVLYDKSGEILWACPRSYDCDTLTLLPETRFILRGALSYCQYIQNVNLPENMEYFPYNTFAAMPKLKSITFSGSLPPLNAKYSKRDVLVIQIPNEHVEINVPPAAKEAYIECMAFNGGWFQPTQPKNGKLEKDREAVRLERRDVAKLSQMVLDSDVNTDSEAEDNGAESVEEE